MTDLPEFLRLTRVTRCVEWLTAFEAAPSALKLPESLYGAPRG